MNGVKDHPATEDELIHLVKDDILPDLTNIVERLEAFVGEGRSEDSRTRRDDPEGTNQ